MTKVVRQRQPLYYERKSLSKQSSSIAPLSVANESNSVIIAKKLEFEIQVRDNKFATLVLYQHDPAFMDNIHRFCHEHGLDSTQGDKLI
jgi:hypothetical protein